MGQEKDKAFIVSTVGFELLQKFKKKTCYSIEQFIQDEEGQEILKKIFKEKLHNFYNELEVEFAESGDSEEFYRWLSIYRNNNSGF